MKPFAVLRIFFALLALVLVTRYAPAARNVAPTGQLSGTLLDGATHEPIPLANVVLLRAADGAYVATATTRTDGFFAFEHLPYGQYHLQPTVLGYEPLRPVIGLSAAQPGQALGAVALRPYGAPLAGVPVSNGSAAKVGNAGCYVLTLARQPRRSQPRPVQL